jgi:hypothetical protein
MMILMINKFNATLCLILCTVFFSHGQRQSKKYQETFKVDKDVVLNINTSHADIEFETWDKNTIEVTGLIEIEDASEEDAKAYFENWNFKALGNSKEVTVSCNRTADFTFLHKGFKIKNSSDFDFVFEMPEIPDVPEIAPLMMKISEMPPMPPMPPLPMTGFNAFSFDYEAYKNEGDEYLKKWKKAFNKNFDEDFKKQMQEWKAEMEAYKEEVVKLREEQSKQRAEIREEMKNARKEERKVREEIKREIKKQHEEASKEDKKLRIEIIEEIRDSENSEPNFYFYSSEGKEKNLKVKKTIKIKMPKNTRLKLNVRHGEVKLAENIKNMKATLSHARLLANSVDGIDTFVEASYSPVRVENWKHGELKVNYIREVSLDKVKSLKLTSNASDVTIGILEEEGFINGSFGKLNIDDIAKSFSNLEVALDNTNAVFVLPEEAYTISIKSNNSQLSYPKALTVSTENKYSDKLVKGYFKSPNTSKSITINARYSKILFK